MCIHIKSKRCLYFATSNESVRCPSQLPYLRREVGWRSQVMGSRLPALNQPVSAEGGPRPPKNEKYPATNSPSCTYVNPISRIVGTFGNRVLRLYFVVWLITIYIVGDLTRLGAKHVVGDLSQIPGIGLCTQCSTHRVR